MYNTPSGGSPNPPDYKDVGKKAANVFRRFGLLALIVIVVLIVVFSSVFTIDSGEEAVITRWGEYIKTISDPGLQFKLPFIDDYQKIKVDEVRRLEFGYRTDSGGNYVDMNDEALMLTQEENLVLADWVVQYRITDVYNWLFKVQNPENTLRIIAESSYRRVTASRPLDDILTNQKESMQIEVLDDLQEICNKYELGVRITGVQLQDASPPDEVREAFLDVTQAIENKNARINEASKYQNENLPVARGEASAIENEAEGYAEQRVNEAEGAVARYKAIEAEYSNQPDIMRTRLYLEMIKEVLPKVSKVYFVDPNGGNLIEFLPLNGGGSTLD